MVLVLVTLVLRLPDLEMVVNVRDWPQADRRGPKLPIFSFSKVAPSPPQQQ